MYDWLTDTHSGTVVTANRRLARVLGDEDSARPLAAGPKAWPSPAIFAWQDWLVSLTDSARDQESLPTRINAHQSQVLWERCLLKEIDNSQVSIGALVRLCRDARQSLADWEVDVSEVARFAQSDDHRLFASVLGRYLAVLDHENWIDDAGLGGIACRLLSERKISLTGQFTFAGFERQRPILVSLQEVMADVGAEIVVVSNKDINNEESSDSTGHVLRTFDSEAAEYRSAGLWAREQIERSPGSQVAIIANGLDKQTDLISRFIRDGATPGWQHGHHSLYDAVNVSYGQALPEYPAVTIALLLLRWLVGDLHSSDVRLLLQSPLLGTKGAGHDTAARSRLELRLRQLPDRKWSPSMISAELRGRDEAEAISDWMSLLAAFSKRRRDLPRNANPAEWVEFFDETLKSFEWPGAGSLSSADFQLINRWRELLNEFARLGLVCATLNPAAAVVRLEQMANETIFQPESTNSAIQLLGPLEASGSQFDAIWITGVSTANWPPVGTPSPLLSRRLQEKFAMPDSTPADTYAYADQILRNLSASANDVVSSFSLVIDDAEQTESELIRPLIARREKNDADPGWYAAALRERASVAATVDAVPPIVGDEKVKGGAGTIQRQVQEPFSAFAHGRLGARVIYPQAIGVPALMRGNLIHDALYKLYLDLPDSQEVRSWNGEDLDKRIAEAVDFAFARHERNLDDVLQQLLLRERHRIAGLVREFVVVDGIRDDFQVAGVEGSFEFVAGRVRMPLRFDRIDQSADGSIAILDYKTGSRKQLLNRKNEVQEIQLFVYAAATEATVSALALVNVDSREIVFDGAGRGFTDTDEWPELLRGIKAEIAVACEELSEGDVRVNMEQGFQSARPLNLLSRYNELRRDHA